MIEPVLTSALIFFPLFSVKKFRHPIRYREKNTNRACEYVCIALISTYIIFTCNLLCFPWIFLREKGLGIIVKWITRQLIQIWRLKQ